MEGQGWHVAGLIMCHNGRTRSKWKPWKLRPLSHWAWDQHRVGSSVSVAPNCNTQNEKCIGNSPKQRKQGRDALWTLHDQHAWNCATTKSSQHASHSMPASWQSWSSLCMFSSANHVTLSHERLQKVSTTADTAEKTNEWQGIQWGFLCMIGLQHPSLFHGMGPWLTWTYISRFVSIFGDVILQAKLHLMPEQPAGI